MGIAQEATGAGTMVECTVLPMKHRLLLWSFLKRKKLRHREEKVFAGVQHSEFVGRWQACQGHLCSGRRRLGWGCTAEPKAYPDASRGPACSLPKHAGLLWEALGSPEEELGRTGGKSSPPREMKNTSAGVKGRGCRGILRSFNVSVICGRKVGATFCGASPRPSRAA